MMVGEFTSKQLNMGRAVYRTYYGHNMPLYVDKTWSDKTDSGKRFWIRLAEAAVNESLRWNW